MNNTLAGAAIGPLNSAPPKGEPANEMERFQSRLSALREHLSMQDDRLARVLTRAFGGRPETDPNKNPELVSNGSVASVNMEIDKIGILIQSITERISDLDRLV